MVKRFIGLFLASLFVSPGSFASMYQINIVKQTKSSEKKENFFLYIVQKGDCLLKILKKFSIPKRFLYKVVKLNNIKNPNFIYPGQKLKLPGSFIENEEKNKKTTNYKSYGKLDLLRKLGVRIRNKGYIFSENRKIPLSKNPIIEIKNQEYMLNFSKLSPSELKYISSLGINVLNPNQLDNFIDKIINSSFSQILKNGKFVLGANDVITYKYDYLVYDTVSGKRVVINKEPDTPSPLKRILASYGISVVEPKFINPAPLEGLGKLVILKGEGLEKISNLVSLLTGENSKKIKNGVLFPKLKLAAVYDSVAPEEAINLKLKGNKVFVLTGNFLYDVESILSLIPIVNKEVRLVLNEPPDTNGKRASFKKVGLLITTPKKTWFMIDDVEKPEEIPYLRYRGVNLIFY